MGENVIITAIPQFLWDAISVVISAFPAGFAMPIMMVAGVGVLGCALWVLWDDDERKKGREEEEA